MASRASKLAAILACIGLMLPPAAAEAGWRTGHWANGMVAGPNGVGWYGPHGAYVPARQGGGWGNGGYYGAYDGGYPGY
jgi:hypothetical protein